MARRLKCIIVNETEFDLTPTLNHETELNFELTHGRFEGLPKPPTSIAKSGGTGDFAVTHDGATPGIDGWACYGLPIGVVVRVFWRDPAAGPGGCTTVLNKWAASAREAEVPTVAFSDPAGAALTEAQAAAADDVVATYTVRLKPDASAAAATPAPALRPAVAATPDGDTDVAGRPVYRTMDDPRLASVPGRRRILAVIGNEFPMSDLHAGSAAPYSQGQYKSMKAYWDSLHPVPGHPYTGTSCTSIPTHIRNLCKATGGGLWIFDIAQLTAAEGWVPYQEGRWPSVGDVYTLYHDRMDLVTAAAEETMKFCHQHHVGFICQVPRSVNEIWVTADGGQGDKNTGQSAELVPRPWQLYEPKDYTGSGAVGDPKTHDFAKPIPGLKYPYFGGGAEGMTGQKRLLGWLDVNHPSIKFANNAALDDGKRGKDMFLYTQSDYDDLWRRVKIVAAYKK